MKQGEDVDDESLLPFSPEAHALKYDVELITFAAERILIAAGSPMRT